MIQQLHLTKMAHLYTTGLTVIGWIKKDTHFFFSVDNKFAGFALIRELDAKMYEIAEFYVCPEFRKNNNSIWFANTVISLFEGEFSFSTRIENVRAIKFWDKFSSQFKSFKSSIKDCYKCWFIKTI